MSHRVSSPGNILYPPSYYQTPTYGFVNIDKLRGSGSGGGGGGPRLRPNPIPPPQQTSSSVSSAHTTPGPRVVKITTVKPLAGVDSVLDGSYYSSQQREFANNFVVGEYNGNHNQLVQEIPIGKPFGLVEHHAHNNLVKNTKLHHHNHHHHNHHHIGSSSLPGHPGFYSFDANTKSNNVKDRPHVVPPHHHPQYPVGPGGPHHHQGVANQYDDDDKRLSDYVTNAYVNRLKGAAKSQHQPPSFKKGSVVNVTPPFVRFSDSSGSNNVHGGVLGGVGILQQQLHAQQQLQAQLHQQHLHNVIVAAQKGG